MSFGYNASTNQWYLDQSTIDAFQARGHTIGVASSNAGAFNIRLDGYSSIQICWGLLDEDLTSNMHATMVLKSSAGPDEFFSGTDAYPDIAYLGNFGGDHRFDLDGDGIADVMSRSSGAFNLRGDIPGDPGPGPGPDPEPIEAYVTRIHFGTGNDSAEDYYDIEGWDCTAEGLGIAGVRVETQANAQKALTEIGDAIVRKDTVRANLGALQNRLENTVSNLRIQAENLQGAESRISDVDVALEMTAFVRNQVLTQAAVSMLSQANSMPQMAVGLIQNA